MKIAVIGLGNVGEAVLKEISTKNKETVGIDIDVKRIKKLSGYNVKDTLSERCDVYILDVYSTQQVFSVMNDIDFSNKPLVIIESTLIPGSEIELRKIVVDKNKSNLVICPHRLNPGDPEHYVFNTKRVIAGATKECLRKGIEFYAKFMKNEDLVITDMKYAVLSKVLENAHRYAEIAIAEEVKMFCNKNKLDFTELRRCVNSKWNIDMKEARDGIKGKCLTKDIGLLNEYFKDNLLFNSAVKIDEKYQDEAKNRNT